MIKYPTFPGKTYVVSVTAECNITTADGLVLTSCTPGEQCSFTAISDVVFISDDKARIVETFNGASPAASGGGKVAIKEIVAVDVLPSEGKEGVLYLVPSSNPTVQNLKDEYIWVKNVDGIYGWELWGQKEIDLSGYATLSDLEQHEKDTAEHKTDSDRAVLSDLEHDALRGLSVVHKDGSGAVDGRLRAMVSAGGDSTLMTSGGLTLQGKMLPTMSPTSYAGYTDSTTGQSYIFSGHTLSPTEMLPYGITEPCVWCGDLNLPLRLRGSEVTINGQEIATRKNLENAQKEIASKVLFSVQAGEGDTLVTKRNVISITLAAGIVPAGTISTISLVGADASALTLSVIDGATSTQLGTSLGGAVYEDGVNTWTFEGLELTGAAVKLSLERTDGFVAIPPTGVDLKTLATNTGATCTYAYSISNYYETVTESFIPLITFAGQNLGVSPHLLAEGAGEQVAAVKTELDSHANNPDIHVSLSQTLDWSKKLTPTGYDLTLAESSGDAVVKSVNSVVLKGASSVVGKVLSVTLTLPETYSNTSAMYLWVYDVAQGGTPIACSSAALACSGGGAKKWKFKGFVPAEILRFELSTTVYTPPTAGSASPAPAPGYSGLELMCVPHSSGGYIQVPGMSSEDIPYNDILSAAHFMPIMTLGMENVASNAPEYAHRASAPLHAQVGMVMPAACMELDGWLPCDGRAYSFADYPLLHSVIGETYGVGDEEGTFRVPDMRGRSPWGASADAPAGTTIEPGLPEITGDLQYSYCTTANYTTTGLFEAGEENTYSVRWYNAQASAYSRNNFAASRANSIYGASDTVQPPALALNWFIYAGVPGKVDWDAAWDDNGLFDDAEVI